jgi:hypothetical protein
VNGEIQFGSINGGVLLFSCFLQLLPSATYFLSTATKSKQKMPPLNCRGGCTAQNVLVDIRRFVASGGEVVFRKFVAIGIVRCA